MVILSKTIPLSYYFFTCYLIFFLFPRALKSSVLVNGIKQKGYSFLEYPLEIFLYIEETPRVFIHKQLSVLYIVIYILRNISSIFLSILSFVLGSLHTVREAVVFLKSNVNMILYTLMAKNAYTIKKNTQL